MSAIVFTVGDGEVSIETDLMVRRVEHERTATTKRVTIEFDTRTDPDAPDVILPEGGTWTVVDQQGSGAPGGRPPVVGRFSSEAEATAAIVGLEYMDQVGVKDGRFAIDGPAED